MPADLEQVVFDAHSRPAQELAPELGDALFNRSTRRKISLRRGGIVDGGLAAEP